MIAVFRLLLVCVVASFAMRGAAACERAAHASDGVRVVAAHAFGAATCAGEHRACDACCCAASCAIHCGLPLAASGFEVRSQGGAELAASSEPLLAGITRAPPLPPPIA